MLIKVNKTQNARYSKSEVQGYHQYTVLLCLNYRTGAVWNVGAHNGKILYWLFEKFSKEE